MSKQTDDEYLTRGGKYRSCLSKKRYKTSHQAEKGKRNGWRVYYCANCDGWHRTSKEYTG